MPSFSLFFLREKNNAYNGIYCKDSLKEEITMKKVVGIVIGCVVAVGGLILYYLGIRKVNDDVFGEI